MAKYRWGLLVFAIALIAILYSLPRVVVDNDAATEQLSQEAEIESTHSFDISPEDVEIISSLEKRLSVSSDNKKSVIFADSLAKMYLSYNELDSSASYIDLILTYDQSTDSYQKAGDLYYQIFNIALDQEKASIWAGKAAQCFEEVLKVDENPDTKAKLAMTKVMTTNPMEGIMMLRGVLEEYPENKTALFNMGLMSIQSGQYGKAVTRFEKLTSIDSTNTTAAYYLAVSYYETGSKEKAKDLFEKLKNDDTDPAITSSADQYLKILNEL